MQGGREASFLGAPGGVFGEGAVRPRGTRTSGDAGGATPPVPASSKPEGMWRSDSTPQQSQQDGFLQDFPTCQASALSGTF